MSHYTINQEAIKQPMLRLLLIGCGNMGKALLKGWTKHNATAHHARQQPNIICHVVDRHLVFAHESDQLGDISVYKNHLYHHLEDIPESAYFDLVVLAVKPQNMAQITSQCARFVNGKTIFISIAAGLTLKWLENHLMPSQKPSDACPIIRCMPNTPASLSVGMLISCRNRFISEAHIKIINDLFSLNGQHAWLQDETHMDSITAISGSGPAYLFYFIETLEKAGVALGLDKTLTHKIVMQTILGATMLAHQSHDDCTDLRQKVTSRGGTTEAALDVLQNKKAFETLIKKAVFAARDRAQKLNQSIN
ncbi:MAG: pyrroline-5-carboxylate reductase [Pseudomonadota bacterium]